MGYEANEKIMKLVKANGPVLPVTVSKEIDYDIIIASAYLATMVSRSELKMSHLRVGGSPLYYLPGQEKMLMGFSDRLSQPDRRTYELLKDKKVLRDVELEPVQRVGLRSIKDFAIPLNVKHEDNVEIFWKWFDLSDEDAEKHIKRILHIEEPPAAKEEPEKAVPVQEKAHAQAAAADAPRLAAKKEAAPDAEKKEQLKEAVKETPRPQQAAAVQRKDEEPKARNDPEPREAPKKPKKQERLKVEYFEEPKEEQTVFEEIDQNDTFLTEVKEFFKKSNIEILESAIVKKGMELDLVISVPSAVGRLTYYCKAKNKKKSAEGDLATAFVQAQMRKLPALYLARGEITKKASEMLGREFRGMTVKVF